jgi:hypothetical protein
MSDQPSLPSAAPGYYPAAPTNTLAILALVFGFVFPIAGIVCGHIARSQIKRTGESGDGLAVAGLILGYVLTGLTVLFVVIYMIFFIAVFASIPWGHFPNR